MESQHRFPQSLENAGAFPTFPPHDYPCYIHLEHPGKIVVRKREKYLTAVMACALAQKACRDGYSALYIRAASLFRDLAIARADGSLRSLLTRLSRIDVLVIDDWAMAPLAELERRDFGEVCEDRYQTRSTILTSQLPVTRWHEQIGDPTAADGILDRLVHNAHRIEMRGDSMRKNRGKTSS